MASNYIGLVSSAQLGGEKINPSKYFDIDDKTFSDILNKQLQFKDANDTSWLSIMGYNPVQNGAMNIQDMILSSRKTNDLFQNNVINPDEKITTSEMITFLSSPFDTHNKMNQSNSNFMDFARKQATNSYTKCASNVVTGLTEFVQDTLKL